MMIPIAFDLLSPSIPPEDNPLYFDIAKRATLAEDPETSGNILSILANDENNYIKSLVLKNKNTPKDIILKLINEKNGDEDILCKIAKSTQHIEILQSLSNNENYRVLWKVAENEYTTNDILSSLAKHDDDTVRLRAVENKNASNELLLQCSNDENLDIQEIVIKELQKRSNAESKPKQEQNQEILNSSSSSIVDKKTKNSSSFLPLLILGTFGVSYLSSPYKSINSQPIKSKQQGK